MILYEGRSLLEPDVDIFVVAVEDKNPKTGRMLMTYILRQDRPPEVAAYDGSDDAICGDCKFRSAIPSAYREPDGGWIVSDEARASRTCYVRLSPAEGADEAMPPSEVWRKWKKNPIREPGGQQSLKRPTKDRIPLFKKWDTKEWIPPPPIGSPLDHQGPCYIGPLPVRIGSYGDPAAVPTRVWAELVRYAKNWTGYTHFAIPKECDQCKGSGSYSYFMGNSWSPEPCGRCKGTGKIDRCDPDLKRYCMASVDTPEEREEAQGLGWRTFSVTPHLALQIDMEKIETEDILCPATNQHITSKRIGKGLAPVTCSNCMLCRGTSAPAPSIWEVAHGTNKENHTW